jgi:hypothetical protein
MSLERSNAILDLSDSNLILGPCKHHPTEHLLENSDPLASKKQRKGNASPGDASVMVSNASADMRKDTLSLMPPPTQLTHTTLLAMEATNKAQTIIVGDESKDKGDKGATTDEDNDTELGAYFITLLYLQQLIGQLA